MNLNSLSNDMKRHIDKFGEFLYIAVNGLYSLSLIFKIHKTLRTVAESFRSGGFGITDRDFWAFSHVDAAFRPWYSKIAKDYHSQGRFGFVWDDGLGMPLGARIYNNWATYKILYLLGHRRIMAVGYAMTVFASTIIAAMHFGPTIGLLAGLVAAGSPLLIGSYTHQGKPEMFWWVFVIPICHLALTGHGLWAGLGWSLLALLNLSVSYMIILLLSPALLSALYIDGDLLSAFVGIFPGVFKNLIRLTYMWRSGFMSTFASEQTRLWKLPLRPTLNESLWCFPFVLSIALSTFASPTPIVGILIVIFGVGFYWLNRRAIYINDPQSFHILFFLIGLLYACLNQSIYALITILLSLYTNPVLCNFPRKSIDIGTDFGKASGWIQKTKETFLTYPSLKPIPLPMPTSLKYFFEQIPDGSRIVAESDGDPRTESKFRGFWQWTEEFLPTRQIDLVSEMYTRAVEPELTDQYLTKLSAKHLTVSRMLKICRLLGISHIVTHTTQTTNLFEKAGFNALACADMAALNVFRATIVNLPPVEFHLFRISSTETVINPSVPWSRVGNELKWTASEGYSYDIRYRYASEFCAYQNGHKLEIIPFSPVEDLPLRFMRVKAAVSGPVIFKFHPRWF